MLNSSSNHATITHVHNERSYPLRRTLLHPIDEAADINLASSQCLFFNSIELRTLPKAINNYRTTINININTININYQYYQQQQ